jgi:hypothetical protein
LFRFGQVRVVSMPSWELFEAQSHEYKQSVFLPGVPVISIEVRCLLQFFVSLSLSRWAEACTQRQPAGGQSVPLACCVPVTKPGDGAVCHISGSHAHARSSPPRSRTRWWHFNIIIPAWPWSICSRTSVPFTLSRVASVVI